MKSSYPFWSVLAFVYAIMFFFCFMTPMVADDFGFISTATTVSSMITKAYTMYFQWDGRFCAYLTTQTMLGIPRLAQSFLSAGLFTALVWAVHVHIFGRQWKEHATWHWPLFISTALWLVVPSFGEAFFWLTGAGYAMGTLGALLFLLPYRFSLESCPPADKRPPVKNTFRSVTLAVGMGGLTLFISMTDYNTPIICILASAACLASLHLMKKRIPLWAWVGLAVMSVGWLLVVIAPGNSVRLHQPGFMLTFSRMSLVDKIVLFISLQPALQTLFILQYSLFFGSIVVLWPRQRQLLRSNQGLLALVLFGILLLAQGAYALAPMPASRAYTAISIFLLIAASIMFTLAFPLLSARALTWIRRGFGLMLIAACAILGYEGWAFVSVNKLMHQRDLLYAEAKTKGSVCVAELPIKNDRFLFVGGGVDDLKPDPAFWTNQGVAAYWGLESVAICPRPLRTLSLSAAADRRPEFKLAANMEALFQGATLNNDRFSLQPMPVPHTSLPEKVTLFYQRKPSFSRHGLRHILESALERPLDPHTWERYLIPLCYSEKTIRLTGRNGQKSFESTGLDNTSCNNIIPQSNLYILDPDAPLYKLRLLPLRDVRE